MHPGKVGVSSVHPRLFPQNGEIALVSLLGICWPFWVESKKFFTPIATISYSPETCCASVTGWVEVTGDGLDMIGFRTCKSLRRGTAGNCPSSSVIIQGLSKGCLVVWPFRALLLPYWNCTIHAATRLPIAKEPCPLVDLHLTDSNGIHTFPFYHVIICLGTHQRPNWIQLVPHRARLYRAQKSSARLSIQMLRLVTCFFEVQLNICTGQLLDAIAISPQVGRGQLTQSDSCPPSQSFKVRS